MKRGVWPGPRSGRMKIAQRFIAGWEVYYRGVNPRSGRQSESYRTASNSERMQGSTWRIRVAEIDHVASEIPKFCRPLKRALINILIVLPSSELLGYFRTSASRTLSITAA